MLTWPCTAVAAVYLVLLHIRRSRSGAEFFKIIRSRKGAVDLLVAYCKQQVASLGNSLNRSNLIPYASSLRRTWIS